jgi:hypothetical protein
MAKATLVKPEPPKPNVLLELSYEEAKTLLIVTDRIGGDPQLSRRKHADKIGQALRDVGLEYKEEKTADYHIYFLDQKGI